MAGKIIEIEADSLEEAKELVKSQTPKGFYVLSEQIIADGRPQTVKAMAETIEAAYTKAQSEIPNNANIVEKKEVSVPERKVISVMAFDEKDAESIAIRGAQQEFGSAAVVESLRLTTIGSKGFLGIGVKPNQYEAEILQQAVVEVTYQTKAKICAEIGKKTYRLCLADPDHPARQFIDEATRIADSGVQLTTTAMMTNSTVGMELVSAIERALEEEPEDLDLLMAKSGALECSLQFKTAEEVIDHILSINPEYFEARQRKAYWEKWLHVFQYPPWSTASTSLHPVMSAHIQHNRSIQLVRDGLQIGIAVVRPVQRSDFPGGLSNRMPSKWVPIWSDTPYGAIVAHYSVVVDNPSDPYKGEAFLSVNAPDEINPASAYWILQRMCHINSCFIILTDGHNILYNSRYIFPEPLKSTLSTISEKMVRQSNKMDPMAYQRACQWHMNTFDMKNVH
jgi:hypothetical protein